jgi:hypothetical protein
MDGAGFFGVLHKILLPNSAPIIVVTVIWQFTNIWNEFLFGASFSDYTSFPLTVALNNLVSSSTGVKEYNVHFAGAFIAAIPIGTIAGPNELVCISAAGTNRYEAMNALLSSKKQIKAAVCYNDVAAFGALSALGEKGLRAGTDFALMGFDNILDTAHSNPPLSTIDIHPTDLGEQAAAILLQRIKEPDAKRLVYTATPTLLLRQTA